MACSMAVDRTPPRRDIGLPKVPMAPAELAAIDARVVGDMAALGLVIPPGCKLEVATQPDRRALACAKHFHPTMPEGWKRLGELPIWAKGGWAVTQSWHQKGGRWILTQSVHQSKGDQPVGSPIFSSDSSKAPQ
jgi:hypothetical protein